MNLEKNDIKKVIAERRVIAIIRGFGVDTCLRLAEAYIKGGIGLVEVTFDQKHPEAWKNTVGAIKAIKAEFGKAIRVGAGTVLTHDQLMMCYDAGGEYMIAPNVNGDLIRKSIDLGLVSIPGAFTPTEAVAAHDAGADFVKLFPAGNLGPDFVKALCAPLSHIKFLAVGGISPDNIADFMRAGCVGAGVGGKLANKEWIASNEWGKITEVAKLFTERSII